MKRAITFADGNNWYHNSKKIINPKDIDFKKLANFVCKHFSLNLINIRYYNSIPDITDNPIRYHKHMEFLNDLKKQGIKIFTRKLQRTSTKEVLKEKKEILKSIDLCEVCRPLVTTMCEDCIGKTKKREKGIDIKIATDMIRKCLTENECDVCILISGDADFIPAMQTIKDAKKEVITASVTIGYSSQLRDGRFRYFYLKKKDLIDNCLKNYKESKK